MWSVESVYGSMDAPVRTAAACARRAGCTGRAHDGGGRGAQRAAVVDESPDPRAGERPGRAAPRADGADRHTHAGSARTDRPPAGPAARAGTGGGRGDRNDGCRPRHRAIRVPPDDGSGAGAGSARRVPSSASRHPAAPDAGARVRADGRAAVRRSRPGTHDPAARRPAAHRPRYAADRRSPSA